MNIEKVLQLSPLERFGYWIEERHKIYLRRKRNLSKPWTDDTILQTCWFTNPYREFDKTTVWFKENIREPLRNNPKVLAATVTFRWFNLIQTGQLLLKRTRANAPDDNFGLFTEWNEEEARQRLLTRKKQKHPIFTGAYIILSSKGCKVSFVCQCITTVLREEERLLKCAKDTPTMEALWEEFQAFHGLGRFMSYELVTDLRHTHLLENAEDRMTWCSQGPGSIRGMNRILRRPLERAIPKSMWKEETLRLLEYVQNLELPDAPLPEMREVEHSLCEYDKYERVLLSQGNSKRTYPGVY